MIGTKYSDWLLGSQAVNTNISPPSETAAAATGIILQNVPRISGPPCIYKRARRLCVCHHFPQRWLNGFSSNFQCSIEMELHPISMHLLVALFGIGSWVAINSIWVELPVLVKSLPEGWDLPSYLTVLMASANIGPLAVTLAHKFYRGHVNERLAIHTLQGMAILASLLLTFFWHLGVHVGKRNVSVPYLSLVFVLSVVCCTSNVTFLPFMYNFSAQYVKTFFLGQGLSALLPSVLALVQGAGVAMCVNSTVNGSSYEIQTRYQDENFSATVFFWFLFFMLFISAVSFIIISATLQPKRVGLKDEYRQEVCDKEEVQPSLGESCHRPMSSPNLLFLLSILGLSTALSYGVLPSVQTYSCLPYGITAFHVTAILSNVAQPVACFLTMLLPCRSNVIFALLSALSLLLGAYILALAALSPCPPLLDGVAGSILVVLSWLLFSGVCTYLQVMIGSLLHSMGHMALLWCGIVIQSGSLIGALTMFPLINVYHLFKDGDPCINSC
uniref:riboflavin transporter 2-like isoform X2 n=1 Tax=Myxine glutinosa TaxID=7769 RepID=UPI00358E03EF